MKYPPNPETPLFVKQVEAEDIEPDIRAELFTDADVIAECDGVCAVCGKRVDVDSFGPDGPAFKWKVPLEKSRQATLANRLLVHNRCL